jgi:hypothetical protein
MAVITAKELEKLAQSGRLTRSQERTYHRAWARGEILNGEPDRGPLPWRIWFNRRFIGFTYAHMILISFIGRVWPVTAAAAVIFFAGFLAGRYW